MTIIQTPLGGMQGAFHGDGLAFRGIRFAKAPVETLRFQPPQPVES